MTASPDNTPPFEELMRRAQNGDQGAYASLLRSIMPLLRAFILPRLGSEADTDDVVQNILLSIHRASHTYDSKRPFKPWMFAIARHGLNDHLRKMYRQGRYPEINLEALANEISAPDVTKRYEQSEYLNKVLEILPERQRKIVVMMKVEGHSAEDTANALDMSVSAVKVAAHRAYKTLALRASEDKKKEV